eukprot:Awhi_evm1s7864
MRKRKITINKSRSKLKKEVESSLFNSKSLVVEEEFLGISKGELDHSGEDLGTLDLQRRFLTSIKNFQSTIVFLDVGHTNLQDKGTAIICRALEDNRTLKHLNLCVNGITNDGCLALSQLLENNDTLAHLNLHSNDFSDEGLFEIGKGLSQNSNLRTLNVWNEFIGIDKFYDIIRENYVLNLVVVKGFSLELTYLAQRNLAEVHECFKQRVYSLDDLVFLFDVDIKLYCVYMTEDEKMENYNNLMHNNKSSLQDLLINSLSKATLKIRLEM